jgi:hypothetical protein
MILFLTQCFEYNEKIYIYPNLTGKVALEYKIPINDLTGNSLIGFLPSKKERFEEIYQVKTQLFEVEDVLPIISSFPYKKVKLEFSYNSVTELRNKIYGMTEINKIGNTITIIRTFKYLQYKKIDNPIFNFFYDFIYDKIKDGVLNFSLYAPSYFDIITNTGNLPLPGTINFQFPLTKMFELNKEFIWIISIKVNPTP